MQILGFNGGYGFTKAVYQKKQVVFPSVIGSPQQMTYHGDLIKNGAGLQSVDDIRMLTPAGTRFVGQVALSQSSFVWNFQNRKRTETDMLPLLLGSACSELGVSGQINLVTGLPIQWYGRDKEILTEQLRGTHAVNRVGSKRQKIVVSEVVIVPEPLGTIYSLLLSPNGKVKTRRKKMTDHRVAVIDIGMHTTNFGLVEGMQYNERSSLSVETGMSKVLGNVAKAVEERLFLPLNLHESDTALRAGQVRVQGKSRKIVSLVNPILQSVSTELLSVASEIWGDGTKLDEVIITGGGASPLGSYFYENFPQSEIIEGSQMANAQGYYNYGVLKWTS